MVCPVEPCVDPDDTPEDEEPPVVSDPDCCVVCPVDPCVDPDDTPEDEPCWPNEPCVEPPAVYEPDGRVVYSVGPCVDADDGLVVV